MEQGLDAGNHGRSAELEADAPEEDELLLGVAGLPEVQAILGYEGLVLVFPHMGLLPDGLVGQLVQLQRQVDGDEDILN